MTCRHYFGLSEVQKKLPSRIYTGGVAGPVALALPAVVACGAHLEAVEEGGQIGKVRGNSDLQRAFSIRPLWLFEFCICKEWFCE